MTQDMVERVDFDATEKRYTDSMFALVKRIWARYDKDGEPDEGWSDADNDVMELLGWNHTLYNMSHPSEADKRAHEIIRRGADLIKPGDGEVVFYLRVSGDNTSLTTHSAPNVEPQAALAKAIEALCAESKDAANCPVHTKAIEATGVVELREALEAADALRAAIRTAGVKRTHGVYEAVMAFDSARSLLTQPAKGSEE